MTEPNAPLDSGEFAARSAHDLIEELFSTGMELNVALHRERLRAEQRARVEAAIDELDRRIKAAQMPAVLDALTNASDGISDRRR